MSPESPKLPIDARSSHSMSEKPEGVPIWIEKYVTDWLKYFANDKSYAEKEKLAMFNRAVYDMKDRMQETVPEIKNLTDAREILRLISPKELHQVITRLKEIVADDGEARVETKVSSMHSKISAQ